MKQEMALRVLKQGKNVFLTGPAGSGKTYVLNKYIEYLRTHSIEPAVTASTGIAATHLGGQTIHSWSGMGIRDHIDGYALADLMEKEYLWKRMRNASILIIDEISMINPNFLEGVNSIAKAFRENEEPFGGLQLVVCGDFFQLPPIFRRPANAPENQDQQIKRFAWQAPIWKEAEVQVCYLDEQHRQGEDPLVGILNDIRDGEISPASYELLEERMGKEPEEGSNPTRLYTHNADVDSINHTELEKIENTPHFFEQTTKGAKKNLETLKKGCMAVGNLELREGSQVMFVRNNYEKGYVNGSLGTVVSFEPSGLPRVALYSGGEVIAANETWELEQAGKTVATISQVPLRLAWAITVHKSQGMSLDSVEVDLSRTFESGQGYVALSRVRSLEGLFIKGFNNMATMVDELSLRVNKRFLELSGILENKEEERDKDEQEIQEEKFIKKCGGSMEEVEYKSEKDKVLETTYEKTFKLLQEGKSLEEIALERSLTEGTVIAHVSALKRQGKEVDLSGIEVDIDLVETVREAYEELTGGEKDGLYTEEGQIKLKPIYKMLDGEVGYDDIKLALLFVE